MSTLYVLLTIAVIFRCHGIPTEEEIISAIDRATIQNNRQKRDADSHIATDQKRAVNSCPHITRNSHGNRFSRDVKGDKRANDLISAVQLLVQEGHSLEDLQHEVVKRAFQEQTINCPTQPTCTSTIVNKYRTADGSCNNVASPGWGQAGRPQLRIAPAAYEDDISTPRAKSVLGGDLPNPRIVSNTVHAAPKGPTRRSKKNTLHLFQLGQFLDHDIILTPVQSIVSDCCSDEGRTDVENCHPIIVPGDDPRFGNNSYCMNFHRSAPIFCPDISPQREQILQREQMNDITSFIDLSNVYGSSDGQTRNLRENDGSGAKLKTAKGNRLPDNPDNSGCISDPEIGVSCSLAGDERVNEQPALTTYHTLFVREHNRISAVLGQYFSDDEILFQETRKIVIGMMQKIVYDEFLPAFLSPRAMKKYNLASTQTYSYNSAMNPTISNAFGIAYRLGHSWIPPNMDLYRSDFKRFEEFKTETTYFNPELTYTTRDPDVQGSVNGLEGLAYYLSAVKSPKLDRFVVDAARNRLFENVDGNARGLDLAALNIQRGRDHGLPPYNAYRKFCGLSELSRQWGDARQGGLIDHKRPVANLLKQVYSSPLDIDLFPGLMTETPVPQGQLGPTMECIIGDQFKRLKHGDRFWYQHNHTLIGFNNDQQAEIQKASMARILCDNFNFDRIHRNAFINKRRVSCSKIQSVDLSKFAPPTTGGGDCGNSSGEGGNCGASGGNNNGNGSNSGGNGGGNDGNSGGNCGNIGGNGGNNGGSGGSSGGGGGNKGGNGGNNGGNSGENGSDSGGNSGYSDGNSGNSGGNGGNSRGNGGNSGGNGGNNRGNGGNSRGNVGNSRRNGGNSRGNGNSRGGGGNR